MRDDGSRIVLDADVCAADELAGRVERHVASAVGLHHARADALGDRARGWDRALRPRVIRRRVLQQQQVVVDWTRASACWRSLRLVEGDPTEEADPDAVHQRSAAQSWPARSSADALEEAGCGHRVVDGAAGR